MSLSGTANNVQPNKEWRLGELGDVVRRTEIQGEQISSIEELLDFLKSSERDDAYASRLLTAVEGALKNIQQRGLNSQAVVAVESMRPNTIPTAIQNCMTSNFSNVYKQETTMALESYAQYGRWGILLLLIGVVLKVLDWIVNKGSPAQGAQDLSSQVDDYISKMNSNMAAASGSTDKIAEQQKSVELIKQLNSLTVKASALTIKLVGGSNSKEVLTAAQLLDSLVSEHKLDKVIDTLSAIKGGPIFSGLFKRVYSRDVSAKDVPREAVRTLLGFGLASTIYSPTVIDSMMKSLPKQMIKAGIRLPAAITTARFEKTLGAISSVTDNLTKCTDELSKLQTRSDSPAINDREVVSFVHGILSVIEQLDMAVTAQAVSIVGRPLGPTDYYQSVGFISKPSETEDLVGYVTDDVQEGHMVYSWMTGHSYLSTMSLDTLEQDGRLNDDDYKRLLGIFQFMLPDNVDQNKGNVGAYKTLLSKFEKLKKEVEALAKKDGMSKTRSPAMDEVSKQITRQLKTAGRPGELQRNRFIANLDENDTADVYAAFKSILRLVRDMLKTGAALQQSVDRHNKSPYVAAKEK